MDKRDIAVKQLAAKVKLVQKDANFQDTYGRWIEDALVAADGRIQEAFENNNTHKAAIEQGFKNAMLSLNQIADTYIIQGEAIRERELEEQRRKELIEEQGYIDE